MKRWKSSLVFLASLLLFVGSVLVPIRAEAASGTYDSSEILHEWDSVSEYIYLDNVYYGGYEVTSETSQVLPDNGSVVYKGRMDRFIRFDTYRDSYINGSYFVYLKFNTVQATGYSVKSIDANLSVDNLPEGMILFSYDVVNSNTEYIICLGFNFYNVESTSLGVRVPLNFDVTLTADYDNSLEDVVSSKYIVYTDVDVYDSINYLRYDTDLQNLFGADSYIANQNQQIIDGILDNTTAVNNAKTGIVAAVQDGASYIGNQIMYYIQLLETAVNTQFSHLFNNMQAWYDGLTNTINDGIDRLVNNYSGTGTTDAANKFDDSAGDLEQVESDLTTITNSSIGSYTESAFDTSVIISLGSSLVYVVTWFSNFWDMGGLFGSILNFGLALTVALFILRLRGNN